MNEAGCLGMTVKRNQSMNLSFENKVALVTGAGSGMGLAAAQTFATEGAAGALVDMNQQCGQPPIAWSLPAIRRLPSAPTSPMKLR
jgi:hypothetical protein